MKYLQGRNQCEAKWVAGHMVKRVSVDFIKELFSPQWSDPQHELLLVTALVTWKSWSTVIDGRGSGSKKFWQYT